MDRRHFLTGLALSAGLAASGAPRAAAAPTLKFRDMYSARHALADEAAEALVGAAHRRCWATWPRR